MLRSLGVARSSSAERRRGDTHELKRSPALRAPVRQVESEWSIAARLPEPGAGEPRGDSGTPPEERQVKEPWIARAQERTDAVDRGCKQQREESLVRRKIYMRPLTAGQ